MCQVDCRPGAKYDIETAVVESEEDSKTISVQLNTGDSRNRLHASIEDVVNAMKEARAPNLPDKAAWLAARSKMASPIRKVGGLKQHGI